MTFENIIVLFSRTSQVFFIISLRMADNSAPSQTYHALCHCGAIRFNVKLSPPLQHPEGQTPEWQPMKPLKCSCSICTRAGYLLVYPNKLDVTWEEGSSERVKKYKFHEGMSIRCPTRHRRIYRAFFELILTRLTI